QKKGNQNVKIKFQIMAKLAFLKLYLCRRHGYNFGGLSKSIYAGDSKRKRPDSFGLFGLSF
ncbi:MAG: hypothetical protein WAX22_01840, partial [Lactococcus hircilactis]